MLGDVGIIKRFRVFRNNNVFLHDKISELCERRRIKSIQESRMIHREGYQRHGDILNATDTLFRQIANINRGVSIATR